MIFATVAPLCPPRPLTAHAPAIPTRTDNGQNRRAVAFVRALCRPHMNASTWSPPLICWTHRRRIATHIFSFDCQESYLEICTCTLLDSGAIQNYEHYARSENSETEGSVVTQRSRTI